MNFKRFLILFFLTTLTTIVNALPDHIVTIHKTPKNEYIISVDSQAHIDYGFSFPITYKFSIEQNFSDIVVKKKYLESNEWININKLNVNFYNHHETYRIDTVNSLIYVSIGFTNVSDTVYLKAENNLGETINLEFKEITKFYDNRDAAVTASADDMASWSQNKFNATIANFLQYNLYLTLAMNTSGMSKETYNFVQDKLNTGFIEAGVHTRTHPGWAAYDDYDSEITGCKIDIINNLELPELYRNGDKEYVYSFIAPNGYFDEIIDSLVGQNKMLVNRLYHNDFFDGFAEWNDKSGTYVPFTVTRAFDPPASQLGWGIGTNDINDLNGKFDEVTSNSGVYHLMCHPNVMEWDKAYPWEHLEYISNKSNLWYVTLGHLYLYHLAQQNYVYEELVGINDNKLLTAKLTLYQNYPNPFNPSTTIKFTIPENNSFVNLKVFDVLGREVQTLVEGVKHNGSYSVEFNANNLSSGIYLYKLQVNSNVTFKKMTLIK